MVKARPNGWWLKCHRCGPVVSDDDCVCPQCWMNAKPMEHGAIWGHEWAAVAWMSAAVQTAYDQSRYEPDPLSDPKGEIDDWADGGHVERFTSNAHP